MRDAAGEAENSQDPGKKRSKWVITVEAIGALAGIAAIVGLMLAIFGGDDGSVAVPQVVGKPQASASEKLEDARLNVDLVRQFSDRPTGRVISQDPPRGSVVEPRTEVTLRVSIGRKPPPCSHAAISTSQIRGMAGISNLRNGQTVGPSVNPLLGAYRVLGADLWIINYSPVADRFYPQSHRKDQPASLVGPSQFRSAVSFGGKSGENYEVIVVLADPGASRFFSRTLREWNESGDFRGLRAEQLPRGLDERDCVTVKLARR